MTIACIGGYPKIVASLIEAGAKVNQNSRDAVSPLILTIKMASMNYISEYKDCIKILLDNKANINQVDEATGDTPLIMSIGKDTFEIFKEILSHHPNVNARNKSGETALYNIVANTKIDNNRQQYLDAIINYKPPDTSDSETTKKKNGNLACDMQMRYQQGKTILHISVENGKKNESIVQTILDKSGLDVDVEDDNGDTPLHLAAQKEFEPGIEMLINLGCDPTQPNRSGRTAFSMTSPSIAPKMTEWMNDPEAVKNREKRREKKLLCEEEEEKERIRIRDEKLQRSPQNESYESPTKSPKKNKQSILLAMTLGNGTLRSTQSRNVHDNSNNATESLSKTNKIKKIEARPWGGSKDTALFQREIRLALRKMKSNVRVELEEIKKSIRELKKTITGESDDEDLENNSEMNSFSDQESANTSHGQINNDNDNDNLDATHNSNNSSKNDSNEQNQSFGDNQVQIDNQINDELSQNSQAVVDVELSAGHEEDQNSEIKIESENKQDDSEINKLLDDDSINLGEHDSNNVDSFDIDNIDN